MGSQPAVALLLLSLAVPGAASADVPAPRVKVAILDFEFGTVTDNWWGETDIGRGVAAQIVDALVNDGSFRVFERKQLATVLGEQDFAQSGRAAPSASALAKVGKVLGVRYLLTGSITKFGGEQKKYSAGAAGGALGPVGMLNYKKAKTEVALTARLIDTRTGEVVLSATGLGMSKKGGGVGLNLGNLGKAAEAAGIDMKGPDYRASAIGEAQDLACAELVARILERAAALPR